MAGSTRAVAVLLIAIWLAGALALFVLRWIGLGGWVGGGLFVIWVVGLLIAGGFAGDRLLGPRWSRVVIVPILMPVPFFVFYMADTIREEQRAGTFSFGLLTSDVLSLMGANLALMGIVWASYWAVGMIGALISHERPRGSGPPPVIEGMEVRGQ